MVFSDGIAESMLDLLIVSIKTRIYRKQLTVRPRPGWRGIVYWLLRILFQQER